MWGKEWREFVGVEGEGRFVDKADVEMAPHEAESD